MEREELLRKRLQELADTAYRRDIVTFSGFLDLQEQHILHSISWKEHGVSVRLFGGYDLAERQMASFLPETLGFEWEFPFTAVQIEPAAPKFSEELGHRDFLGAVMNLGLDRSRLGDILVEDNRAWLFCEDRIADFLCQELTAVRRTPVRVSLCRELTRIPPPRRKEVTGSVASVRLDSVTALAFQESRSSMLPLIEGGKVFVNGRQVTSNGFALREDDIISVRGKGKFQFGHTLHTTKKGRNMVVLYRYQ